ncbi:hypothetical protein Hanom_Chr16g01442651 [Helianthus anomalus]
MKKKAVHVVVLTICLIILKCQNDLILSSKRVHIERLLGEVQPTSFLWIIHQAEQ